MIPNYVVNWAYHIVDVFSYVQLKVVFSIVKYSLIFLMWIWHHPSIPIEDTTIIYIYIISQYQYCLMISIWIAGYMDENM